jgi:hypothetical protein
MIRLKVLDKLNPIKLKQYHIYTCAMVEPMEMKNMPKK